MSLPVYSLLLLVFGCAEPAPPSVSAPVAPQANGPDVLLVTIDTLRADRVGAYGDPLAATPQLDGLAAHGVLFREAIATAPLTLPSHASMLTGLYPGGHGLRDNGGFRLDPGVPTLAGELAGAGYRTGAFVSAYVLDAAWGLDRGFERYHAPFHPQDVSEAHAFGALEVPGADTVNAALAFLRQDDGRPTFCWVHLFDPHLPWAEHPGWQGDPYRGEVAFVDGLLGRLLRGVDEQTLVIVVGDHGESLWDHGERGHGLLLSRSATRVPLVVRPPGGLEGHDEPAARPGTGGAERRPQGVDAALDLTPVPDAPRAARVVETPVSGVDVAATIAAYAGLAPWGDGVSLRDAIEGRPFSRDPVYTETFFPRFHYGWSELALVQQDRTRLRLGPALSTLDLAADPAEQVLHPVDDHPLRPLAERLLGDGLPEPGRLQAGDAERLAALGYVEPVEGVSTPRADLADPRDKVEVLARLHSLEVHEDDAAAIAGLEALAAAEPALVEADLALALRLAAVGRLAEALDATLAVLEVQPRHTMALSNAASLCRQLGRRDQGIELARRMQVINPQDPRGYRLEVVFWVDAEQPAEVLRVASAGLEVEPDDPQLLYLSGLASIFLERYPQAIEVLERASRSGSRAGDIQLYLGTAHDRLGEVDAALAAYDAYSRTHPDDQRAVAAAAWMLYEAEDCPRAAPLLTNLVQRGHGRDPRIREAYQVCVGE